MNITCFVAREPGYLCLERLIEDGHQVERVFTHIRKPSSEDTTRGNREDYERFFTLCQQHDIPCNSIDSWSEQRLKLTHNSSDLIFSCNWKYLLPMEYLELAKLGTINLHRGKLPEYRGLEPVKRAILNGDKQIFITAHKMAEEYDTGEKICEISILADTTENEVLEDVIERLKVKLYPYYPLIMIEAIEKLKMEAR